MNKPLVVLISGKMRSGKNTFADLLEKHLDSAQNFAFADPLKQLCHKAFTPLTDLINGNIMPTGVYKQMFTETSNWYEEKNAVTRRILQAVGTDIVRKIDPDYWTKQMVDSLSQCNSPVATISDWRFPSEFDLIAKHFNTITVRVERPNITNHNTTALHSSETALDEYPFTFIIDNSGTLLSLEEQAQSLAYRITEELLD